MREYEIVDALSGKQNIEYYEDGVLVSVELYSQAGFTAEIKPGYRMRGGPNWNGLTQSLWGNPALFGKAMSSANQNVYSTLLKVLTDGEINSASEAAFLQMFNKLGITWTQAEKDTINGYLTANNFTIQVT